MSEPPARSGGSFGWGLILGFLLQFLQIILAWLVAVVTSLLSNSSEALGTAFVPIFLFGFTQLVCMLPAIWIQKKRGHPETMKGLIVAAAIIFLLNAACLGLIGISWLTKFSQHA